MIARILKYLFRTILVILLASLTYLIIPRTWSALQPAKPPLGYHFIPAAYAAIWLGLENTVNTSPEVPDEIEELRDIEYKKVNSKSLQLDMYRLKNSEDTLPLLLFIHGGSWKGGKRSDYLVYLLDFARKGYMTATVSYRLLGDSTYPACTEDIRDALKWVFDNGDNYCYDPDRIAIIGGSAGGHLAMLGAYGWSNHNTVPDSDKGSDNRIKAVVNFYGPSDLTTSYARNHPLVTALIARSWEECPELFYEASPVTYLDENDPPTLIFHGTSDRLVPVSQSDELKAKLDSLGIPCEYYRLPLWPHTMDIVVRVNDFCQEKMEDFFKRYLNPVPSR